MIYSQAPLPRIKWLFQFLILTIIFTSCGTALKSLNPEIIRLKNRGPVPLSAENPFIAANALLIKELNLSQELRGFIKHRGGPSALEVRKDAFTPLTIDLFYPDQSQYYSLEQSDSTWLITGPYPIAKQKLQELKPIVIFKIGKPNLIADTKLNISNLSTSNSDYTNEKTKIRQKEIMDIINQSGDHPAEQSPSGDIVHYVLEEGENLNLISEWYTFDSKNSELIAKTNKISLNTPVSPGDTIIIPHNLVKNNNRLSSDVLIRLNQ